MHFCQCCNYSTVYKHVYDKHLLSKRHKINETPNNTSLNYECIGCKKKYKNRSGLWQHSHSCSHLHTIQESSSATIELTNVLVEKFSEMQENIQEQIANIAPSNINSNNTVNNINLTFLNTHCGNAMNIDDFVNALEFIKKDFLEIGKHRFFIKGANNILKEKLESIATVDLPVHCVRETTTKPTSFYVRDKDQWVEECQAMIEFQMKYIDNFEEAEDKTVMLRFFEKYNNKFFETYQEKLKTDTNLHNITERMSVCEQSGTQIDMLSQMSDLDQLKMDKINPELEPSQVTPLSPSNSILPSPELSS